MTRDVFDVHVQTVDEPFTKVDPRCVDYDSWPEAASAIERALRVLPGATVMVGREVLDDGEPFAHDPDLDDWPARRHLRLLRDADQA